MRTLPVLILPLLLALNTLSFSVKASESWWLRNSIQYKFCSRVLKTISTISISWIVAKLNALLCSDQTKYYDLDVYVELELDESSVEVVRLNLPYSNLSHTKLQAYLRQDGFAQLNSHRKG